VKPLTHTCTFVLFKTLQKSFRRVRCHKSCWSPPWTRKRTTTHKPENTGGSHITRRTVLRHPPYSQDLTVADLRLFGAHRYAVRGERFGRNGEIIEEVTVSTQFKLVEKGDSGSCFWLAQDCWSWWRLCRKVRCVVHPSSYPMSRFKEMFE
jgi:hypothetical protein